ncbi:hypothetical protein L226DRAFT_610642 [Lentinus tigrinus ALCF2SS1-7]|uniref:RPA43 OB domain-containing protein n=1 Tax=Lentinus tigrinus ALCF2SS1-6 TaxID=1328759 RepID=A0A5C2S240_9APHY|nr:hypothetical protein L227DRAFT_530300 [Lentinus tigrinus ALCF2SS1-6]RPD78809.1 hypothetical protein L226DRAFT_610642 [Lentinus tigrinus ALCF2SS1-7]
MSQMAEAHKTKKRKHAAAVLEDGAAAAAAEPSTKRSKKDKDGKVHKHKVKHTTHAHHKGAAVAAAVDKKGKGRATDDAFRVVRASLNVSVSPVFANDLRGGVEEMLDSMLMRYIPALRGVVLAHDRLEFLDKVATIKADCPFANCRVAFDATVWSPQVGMKLSGKINLCSPDHISLLVHRTFNVSIPRHHIPTDSYEFEYGPAENDPEFGAGQENAVEGAAGEEGAEGHGRIDGGGRWVHKSTGTKLGDPDGYLEFTVVGLTIANQMLSLVGSIQPDPFSPEHVPKAAVTTASAAAPSRSVSEREVDALMAEQDEEEESDDDLDPFQKLGKMADENERRAREAQEEEARKEKKRKRKEGKGQDGAASTGEKKSKKKKS